MNFYHFTITKYKAIYETLNMLQSNKDLMIGYAWSHLSKFEIDCELRGGPVGIESGSDQILFQSQRTPHIEVKQIVYHHLSPPTYFATNDFSRVFQIMVDTYGVAKYREANPAFLTSITFPFFFGVMFGDIGHGSLLLVFGLILTQMKQVKNLQVLY